MENFSKIFTSAGLTKVPLYSAYLLQHKIRLYFFSDQTREAVAKVQRLFELGAGIKVYKRTLGQMFQEVKVAPYLLRMGNTFQLIVKEDALILKHIYSPVIENKNVVQERVSIREDSPKTCPQRQSDSIQPGVTSSYKAKQSLELIKIFLQRICVLGSDPIPLGLMEKLFYISYSRQSFPKITHVLSWLTRYSILQEYPSALLNCKLYTIPISLQIALYEGLSFKQQQETCGLVWSELGPQLIKDKPRPDQGIYFYLEHYAALLNRKALISTMDPFQKYFSHTTLGYFFSQEQLYQKSIFHLKMGLENHQAVPKNLKSSLQFNLNLLGNVYQALGKGREALEYHNKALKQVFELNDEPMECSLYGDLGIDYYWLEEIDQSIKYHQKALKIALKLKIQIEEGRAYGNLGNCYRFLGDTHQAIQYFEKSLEIIIKLNDKRNEGEAYGNLGNAYHCLGKIHQAIEYHQKSLKIAIALNNKATEDKCYTNLGNAHYSLKEDHQAIEYHKRALKITEELGIEEGQQRSYCNLGNSYTSLGELDQALECYEKQLTISLNMNYKLGQELAYGNIGNIYQSLGKYHQAAEYQHKSLEVALELKDEEGIGRVYSRLGTAYSYLGDYARAISYLKKGLKIALTTHNQQNIGSACANLGFIYYLLKEPYQAEHYLRQSIESGKLLQYDAKEPEWQVKLFEGLSNSYLLLEKLLVSQERIQEALQISDERKYRVLSSLISQKNMTQGSIDPLLTFQKMQALAQKMHTVFVSYSLTFLDEKPRSIYAWIVSPKKEALQGVSFPILQDTFSNLDLIFKAFPYQLDAKRPTRGEKKPSQLFHEKLAFWYDLLINPLEEYLPLPASGETLTFIPDGFLAHLPFGAFYNQEKGKYLIEDYPISIAPSMQVLSLLGQLPKQLSSQTLLMGNPTTPHGEDQLEHAEREVKDVILPMMKGFENKLCIQKKATVESVFQHAPNARVIHIACHGVAEKKPQDDPYSVFEGFFKLAPDMKHSGGELHAKEVNSLSLKADLVFMSACHLGRGNLQKEGSIGPIWSFLGAGAKSTIASYWPLPEGEMTVKMVDTFYRHYLGIDTPKLDKAKALQQAVLMAMTTERDNPRQWGSFFLSGLIK